MQPLHVTQAIAGIGGRVREADDDFVVEELPLYAPSGVGDHLHLVIEKRGRTTHDAVRDIARALGIPHRDIGYAGQKDAHARTVQTLSVEHVREEDARAALADVPGVRLLDVARHGNKLRLGHLAGNRFTIRVRDAADGALGRARAALEILAARGCPNRFGEQRFGRRGDNAAIGRALVLRDADLAVRLLVATPLAGDEDAAPSQRLAAEARYDEALAALPRGRRAEAAVLRELARGRAPGRALRSLPDELVRLYVSAYQSALWNRLLDQRMPELGRLEAGDLAYLHDRGAVFRVEDAAAEQPRADRLEISPSAPLYGTRTLLADGAPGARERELLAAEGVAPEAFRVPGAGDLRGERRPLRVPVGDASAEPVPDAPRDVLVRFTLPRGSFATALLAELQKGAAETDGAP